MPYSVNVIQDVCASASGKEWTGRRAVEAEDAGKEAAGGGEVDEADEEEEAKGSLFSVSSFVVFFLFFCGFVLLLG
ncbi:hypothetical protein TRV_01901 [Trichophyton verrucosum HKI 0517]|uniref:Uncharacterized protein n=1 Tax=Trichophyton verrucosum (strain HKI 0517) TaxID=663202 RepID=D4D486_TRIVH|nr:uncharacterized protein TRV_01901 [Trichophyton verrucosum HKI 0517]EFE43341.1 hypothetical protein TRV_01901 [Trichophyton verrucosum HKI 0517]